MCVSCASSVACRHACVGGHACAVVLAAQLLASGSAPWLVAVSPLCIRGCSKLHNEGKWNTIIIYYLLLSIIIIIYICSLLD